MSSQFLKRLIKDVKRKIFLILDGHPVHKFGQIVGYATSDIRSGEWVHTRNLGFGKGHVDGGGALEFRAVTDRVRAHFRLEGGIARRQVNDHEGVLVVLARSAHVGATEDVGDDCAVRCGGRHAISEGSGKDGRGLRAITAHTA